MINQSVVFSFFAILHAGKDKSEIKRIRVANDIQKDLTEDFLSQAEVLAGTGMTEKPYDGNDILDRDEVYVIDSFPISTEIENAVKFPNEIEDLLPDDKTLIKLKAVFAGAFDSGLNSFECLFQTFNRSKAILPKRSLIFKNNLFQKMVEYGIRLDTKIVAVFRRKKLYFLSSSSIKSFLDISLYFQEASDEEIKGFLNCPKFDTHDSEKILKLTTSWMRHRFTSILKGGFINEISPKKIKEEAQEFGIDVKIDKKNGKDVIIFPEEKPKIRDLLKFLNEEFFYGILSNKCFETPIKRNISRGK